MEVPCESNWHSVSDWLKTLPADTAEDRCVMGQDLILEEMQRSVVASEEWHRLLRILRFIGEFIRMDREPFVGLLSYQERPDSLAA